MATPEAPRLPEQGLARVAGKAARGQNMGRMTGLSPVPRRGAGRSRRAASGEGPTSGLILDGTSSWSEVQSWGDAAAAWDTSSFNGIGLTAGAYQVSASVTLSVASGEYVRFGLAYQFTGAFAFTPPENVAQGPTGSVSISVSGAFHLDADDSYAVDMFANRYTSSTGAFIAAATSPFFYLSAVRLSA